MAKLTASDRAPADSLGSAADIADDTVVVGASFDDDAGNFSGSAYVFELTPSHLLLAAIEDLVDSGTLNKGQGQSLISSLEIALSRLDAGNDAAAIGVLSAFINKVNAFIAVGVLSLEDGQALIDAANAIIEQLVGG